MTPERQSTARHSSGRHQLSDLKPRQGTSSLPSQTTSPRKHGTSYIHKSNFGNDYSDYYSRTGVLPQSHILNIENPQAGYPKLQRLHDLKKLHTKFHAGPPQGRRSMPSEQPFLLHDLIDSGAQFDVVMVHGCISVLPSLSELKKLPIGHITPKPSLLFIWAPAERLSDARTAMEFWGFRRAENIVFASTSTHSPYCSNNSDNGWTSKPVLRPTTWHCLMGLKGTLRRSEDTDVINCNVDTDFIVEKQQRCGPAGVVPDEIYSLIENFTNLGRRLHIVPTKAPESLPVLPRPGWAIISPDILLHNLNAKDYTGGRKLVPVKEEIDLLRPRTPLPRRH